MGAGALFATASAVSVGSQIMGAFSERSMSKYERQQYDLQSKQLELQKEILSDQYRTKRNQLQGEVVAKAAANGVKVSGSVAETISNSLTELGMEESYRKFNIDTERNNLAYKSKMSKLNAKGKFYANMLSAGTTALSSAAVYNQLWGSPSGITDVTGTARSGGNVKFTNASYGG